MKSQLHFNLRLMLLAPVLCLLQACAVGIVKIDAPELPLTKPPVSIREVYFEVCPPPKFDNRRYKEGMNEQIISVLKKDFNIEAHPQTPPVDKPYFHFLVIPKETEELNLTSVLISFFSFSIIPGYGVDRTETDIRFVARDADGKLIRGDYMYEQRSRLFLWLPLILYPDIVASINGGYANDKKDKKAFETMIYRFILDASERMNQEPKDDKIRGAQVLNCFIHAEHPLSNDDHGR